MARASTFFAVLAPVVWVTSLAHAAPPVDWTTTAVVERFVAKDGTAVVVSPAPGAPMTAVCTTRSASPSRELLRELALRSGTFVTASDGDVSVGCAVVPTSELAFALRVVLGEPPPLVSRRTDTPSLLGDDEDAPAPRDAAQERVRRLSLEGISWGRPVVETTTLVVTGSTEVEAVKRDAAPYLGALAVAPDGAASPRPSPSPRQTSERLSAVESPVSSPRSTTAWFVPDAGSDETAALFVLTDLLEKRLPRLLVGERSLARRADAELALVPSALLPRVFVEATTKTSLDRIRRFVDGTLKKMRLVGPTQKDVERTRAGLVLQALQAWEDPLRRAARLALYEITRGDARRALTDVRSLAAVTPERVRRAAAERFVNARRSTVEEYPPLWPADDAHLEKFQLYTVRAGDTLEEVARRFHLAVAKVARANDLDTRRQLTPGQPLWIPPN